MTDSSIDLAIITLVAKNEQAALSWAQNARLYELTREKRHRRQRATERPT